RPVPQIPWSVEFYLSIHADLEQSVIFHTYLHRIYEVGPFLFCLDRFWRKLRLFSDERDRSGVSPVVLWSLINKDFYRLSQPQTGQLCSGDIDPKGDHGKVGDLVQRLTRGSHFAGH